ncbi:MAG: SMP-30/gluconolactonase/LRE family protein [Elusimicrobia bacterium]|nr:SMP-30/gluconolactonase/LRE family protein [Elusimicrobiota bacterium]
MTSRFLRYLLVLALSFLGSAILWAQSEATLKTLKNATDPTFNSDTDIGLPFDPPIPTSLPDDPGFRSYSTVIQALDSLDPTLVSRADLSGVADKTTSVLSNPILVYRISTPGTQRKNDPSSRKPQILIIGGAHAREWMPMEAVARFATVLVSDYNLAAANSQVRYLLENAEIYVVPTLNIDGRLLTEQHPAQLFVVSTAAVDSLGIEFDNPDGTANRHGRMRRKNLEGVGTTLDSSWSPTFSLAYLNGTDINRNGAFAWDGTSDCPASVSTIPESLAYRGPSRESSREILFLHEFLAGALPALTEVIDLHMAAQTIFWPKVSGLFSSSPASVSRDARTSEVAMIVHDRLNSQPGYTFDLKGCIPVGSIDTLAGASRLVPSMTIELGPSLATGIQHFVRPHDEVLPAAVQAFAGLYGGGRWAAQDPYLRKVLIQQTNGSGPPKIIYQDEIKSDQNGRSLNTTSSNLTGPGTLTVQLQFSMPMSSDGAPVVILESGSRSVPVAATGAGWSTSIYENDTWSGTLTLPADFPDGTARLTVDAADEFGGKLDGKPLTVRTWSNGDWANYEDENGKGSDGGRDARVKLVILRGPLVQLGFIDPAGLSTVYQIQGPNAGSFKMTGDHIDANFRDSGIGVSSVKLESDNPSFSTINLTYDPPNKNGIEAFLPPVGQGLPEGNYTFTVTNASGAFTSAKVQKYLFTAMVDPATKASYDEISKAFRVSLFFTVSDDAGGIGEVKLWTSAPQPDGSMGLAQVLKTFSGGGAHTASFSISGDQFVPLGFYAITAEDSFGNSVIQSFALQQSQGVLSDNYDSAAKFQVVPSIGDNNTPAGWRLDFDLTADPGSHIFYPLGTITTQIHDLFTAVGGNNASLLVAPPPSAIGAALIVPPTLAFDLVRTPFTAGTPEPAGDTGLSLTYQVATSSIQSNIASSSYRFVAQRKMFEIGDISLQQNDYYFQDAFSTPLTLQRFTRWNVTLTNNSVVVGLNGAGSVSVVTDRLSLRPDYAVASLLQGPGLLFFARDLAGICDITSPASNLKVVQVSVTPLPGSIDLGANCSIDPILLFPAPATLTINFSTAVVAQNNVDPNTLAIYEQDPNGSFFRLDNQLVDPASGTATAFLPSFPEGVIFGVFGSSKVVSGGGGGGGGGPTSTSALAIAVGPAGKLWEVVVDDTHNVFTLARWSADGKTLETSTVLPDAIREANWAVEFDTMGAVYAVGVASGPRTLGLDLAVYKASDEGVPISSTGLHAGIDGKSFSLDATGDIWITGGVQSGAAGGLALWRYCVHTSSLTRTASYSRGGGFDAGFGVRVVNGNIWVAGYSMDPAHPGPLELGLWEYDASGTRLIGGPFFRTGYLSGFEDDFSARLEVSSGSLFVAAQRSGTAGEPDLAMAKFDLAGQALLERSWVDASQKRVLPRASAVDGSGNFVVAGRLNDQSGNGSLGVWKYSPQGVFLGAATSTGASGGAKGLAFSGADAWLALDNSSAPFRLANTSALAGTDVFISSSAPAPTDTTPPVTTLTIGSPQFALSSSSLLVSGRTPFTLSATDAGSGVKQTQYQINGGPLTVYTASFTLTAPDGSVTLGDFSTDNAGNQEVLRSSSVVLDATPPAVSLVSPGPQGFCSIVKGALPVVGSVSDLHLVSWQLTANGAAISSGTSSVSSSVLGTWDSSSLSGWQTLRLSASDLVLNASTATQSVFVGDPSALLAVSGLSKPQGAAMSAEGSIYAADRNNDRIAVFSPTGSPIASFNSQGLNKPEAVAVDVAGNIYVADANNKRALKISPLGQVLLTIPGMSHPDGIALDASGNIFVADLDKSQVKKFGPDGSLLKTFTLPNSQPAGIALDAAGNLYAADPKNNQLAVFDPSGSQAQTFGAGLGLSQPSGVAVIDTCITKVLCRA